ncbi:nitrilase-related carbon-nitrogen hydrolase [Pseudonocardia sp. HH130630-07]|uniref:nitrilase-related carbon-nitrogen hydrolase n=1 Tax=Pseudonocardia sp. HH130630-07 TaxID=1690815 RepID=UPI0018D377BC|nr:nitrilase-related carbon-nitrogen hydrolase [Pseudonocardia sp. HH130630-07]
MHGPVTVAACRIPARIDAPDPSIAERAVREAVAGGARLVVLPELTVCGYVFADAAEARAAAEPLDGPTVARFAALSADPGCVLVAGLAELGADGRVYNTAVVVEGGRLRAAYRKVHLWDRERELFTPGDAAPPVVATAAGRIAPMVCYDLEFPEWVRRAAEDGAEIVAAPVNWPWRRTPDGQDPLEVAKVRAVAGAYRVHVVAADRCGTERGVTWFGAACVADADGDLLAGPGGPPPGEPGVLLATLDPAQARDKRLNDNNHVLRDRRPELYRDPVPAPDGAPARPV